MAKNRERGVNKAALITWIASGLILVGLVVFVATRNSPDGNVQGIEIANGSADVDKAGLADFTLTSLDGADIALAGYRGQKPVILDFWATWCPNCRRDMPVLNRLYQKYKEDVEVIAVNLRENERTVRRFVEEEGFTFPVVLDPRGKVSREFGIQYTNTHVFINKNGRILKVLPGDIAESDFLSLINES
ncbi:MAG: TlpA family protein disulfide reductase [Candidatus Doudnabacteria bacterium]|nr:TlpA family protein disulfide reductase [Candidatus Doudnabacteria bacterium]